MSIVTSNVVQYTVEIINLKGLMIGLFDCLDDVFAKPRWYFIVKTTSIGIVTTRWVIIIDTKLVQVWNCQTSSMQQVTASCHAMSFETTYFWRRYSSNTRRSFCAGAHSLENMARPIIVLVLVAMKLRERCWRKTSDDVFMVLVGSLVRLIVWDLEFVTCDTPIVMLGLICELKWNDSVAQNIKRKCQEYVYTGYATCPPLHLTHAFLFFYNQGLITRCVCTIQMIGMCAKQLCKFMYCICTVESCWWACAGSPRSNDANSTSAFAQQLNWNHRKLKYDYFYDSSQQDTKRNDSISMPELTVDSTKRLDF